MKFVLIHQLLPYLSRRRGRTHILYPAGTMLLAMMATPTIMTHDRIQTVQNRFHIAGHSLKKWDSSTSLMVDAHCMLYPVKWASLGVS